MKPPALPTETSLATEIPIRDIHLPEAISWWPLAPGWWVLLALCVLLSLLFWLTQRNKSPKKKANAALTHAKVIYELNKINEIQEDREFLQNLSVLLKRVAMTKYGNKVAGLSGEKWLRFLDSKWTKTSFSKGRGRVLIDSPYQENPTIKRKTLLKIVKSWMEDQTDRIDPTQKGATNV